MEDDELDTFIEEDLEKDITQVDSIDEEKVEEQLGQMGFLWDRVNDKLSKDGVCFNCKRDVDFASEQVAVREATKVDKGVVAFVAICDNCIAKHENNEV